ncbi:high-potential iron-sulfur protein [Haladaptatus pallidirubidus]|uniref:high-potential iron-sulfur protein n=1 Tax=Haladaptatus pallidirubidus TaxID=1008152 RepID=UPI0035EE6EB0
MEYFGGRQSAICTEIRLGEEPTHTSGSRPPVASGIVVGVAGCTSNNDGSKSSKSAVDYQDSPRNGNQCSECRYYRTSEDGESVGSCTKVEGDIAPEAWCNLYVSG